MSKTKTRHGLIAALDVGTTKVCCFIALAEEGEPRVIGIGHQVSRGMRNGAVVDMEEAETSIRATVAAAEQMAKERIREVVLSVSGGRPGSINIPIEVAVNGHEIGDQDIRRVFDFARQYADGGNGELIHSFPIGFSIDDNEGVRDPRGMYGERLKAVIHQIRADSGPVRNLSAVVQRCHLDIESRVVSAYASALACLVEDERNLGVTCIDMGGGTTTLSVFQDGHLLHVDSIPVGGAHVTNDIARGLATPLAQAERMKTLYGNALPSPSDDREALKVPLVGEDEDGTTNQVSRSMLVQIIQPRLEETFEMVRDRLDASGMDKLVGRRVVLTGGASQMQGVRDLAALVLNKQVRLGRPLNFLGLPEATSGPAFSTCAGLLRYAMAGHTDGAEHNVAARTEEAGQSGLMGRVTNWFKNNF